MALMKIYFISDLNRFVNFSTTDKTPLNFIKVTNGNFYFYATKNSRNWKKLSEF